MIYILYNLKKITLHNINIIIYKKNLYKIVMHSKMILKFSPKTNFNFSTQISIKQ